jgi:hypothetical protein
MACWLPSNAVDCSTGKPRLLAWPGVPRVLAQAALKDTSDSDSDSGAAAGAGRLVCMVRFVLVLKIGLGHKADGVQARLLGLGQGLGHKRVAHSLIRADLQLRLG